MPECALKKPCVELQRLLRRVGVDGRHIRSECSSTQPCLSAFANLKRATQYINVDNVQAIDRFVRRVFGGRLPVDSSASTRAYVFDRPPFYCVELKTEIRQPCQVTSCAFWTDNTWTRNCIRCYCLEHHRDTLEIKELTFLLGETSTDLRKRANSVLADMRKWALKHRTEQDAVAAGTPDPDTCIVCKNPLPSSAFHRQGYVYCTPDCAEVKPPLELNIEGEFSLPIARILQISAEAFAGKRPICHALGVTNRQLEKMCERHQVDISGLQ